MALEFLFFPIIIFKIALFGVMNSRRFWKIHYKFVRIRKNSLNQVRALNCFWEIFFCEFFFISGNYEKNTTYTRELTEDIFWSFRNTLTLLMDLNWDSQCLKTPVQRKKKIFFSKWFKLEKTRTSNLQKVVYLIMKPRITCNGDVTKFRFPSVFRKFTFFGNFLIYWKIQKII